MKKIAITGPESTGKSSLAESLSLRFAAAWVSEYARVYLKKLDGAYTFDDITLIAKGQAASEDLLSSGHSPFLFCDSDMLVCKVWQEYKYGFCDPWVEKAFQERHYDLFLLCNTDLPWVYDPLREHPARRGELFSLYLQALESYNKPFIIISGQGTERLNMAIDKILNFDLKIKKL